MRIDGRSLRLPDSARARRVVAEGRAIHDELARLNRLGSQPASRKMNPSRPTAKAIGSELLNQALSRQGDAGTDRFYQIRITNTWSSVLMLRGGLFVRVQVQGGTKYVDHRKATLHYARIIARRVDEAGGKTR
ncbi:MAG: hypothetical protein ISS72_03505 [Candidatus Brocadiae bacterium]|nr:hypothetical protein [Candidatus Brocadiia bacterium]